MQAGRIDLRTFPAVLFIFLIGAYPPMVGAAELSQQVVPAATLATGTQDDAAVLLTVDRFFSALASHDVAGAVAILHPNGVLFALRHGSESGDGALRHLTNSEWLDQMRRWTQPVEEHTSDSRSFVRGPIGVVWQNYSFEVDGRFSHCGVNIVSLVRSAGVWKIASIVWTVERSNCP